MSWFHLNSCWNSITAHYCIVDSQAEFEAQAALMWDAERDASVITGARV